jgi:uncharacterized protein (DUF4415 family)
MRRPALTVVESSGRRRRLQALPSGQPAGEQPWRAAFAWDGNGATVERAELELGRRLVVELPPPRRPRSRRRGGQTAALPTPAVAALEAELAEAREELGRLHHELDEVTRERDALSGAHTAAEQSLGEEHATAEKLRAELAERAAAPAPSTEPALAAARTARPRRPRGRPVHATGAHRVPAHPPNVKELWGARIAAAVLAGLLLVALALVLGVVL